MEIKNLNDKQDVVTVVESKKKGIVFLKIGTGPANRHAYLSQAEARAVAYALLFYAEQGSN